MDRSTTIKEIMINIFDFPHIPYWFTIRQAIEILKRVSAGKEQRAVVTDTLLVFDEKYNYMGMVRLRDIIIGLESKLLKKTEFTGPMTEVCRDATNVSEAYLASIAETMFGHEAKKEAEKQINEIMTVSKVYVSPDDSPAKASYLMARYNLPFLPVLENKQKLIGMVSISAVFKWIASVITE